MTAPSFDSSFDVLHIGRKFSRGGFMEQQNRCIPDIAAAQLCCRSKKQFSNQPQSISGSEADLRAELPASGAWALPADARSEAVWSAATKTKDFSPGI
jgi:hypothetical protein